MFRTAMVMTLLSVAACQGNRAITNGPSTENVVVAGPISMTTDSLSYRAGERVSLSIRNHTSGTWGFNPCNRMVERHRDGNRWEEVAEPQRVCTMELWMLEPRAIRDATTNLPSGIPGGTYRLTVHFSSQTPGESRSVRASTQPFQVR